MVMVVIMMMMMMMREWVAVLYVELQTSNLDLDLDLTLDLDRGKFIAWYFSRPRRMRVFCTGLFQVKITYQDEYAERSSSWPRKMFSCISQSMNVVVTQVLDWMKNKSRLENPRGRST